MKNKTIRKKTILFANIILYLFVSIALTGCSERSVSSHEQKETSSEEVETESILEPEVYLSDSGLIFKTDVDGLSEQVIPNYEINKVDRAYAGNEEIGGKIYESSTRTNISYREFGNEAVNLDEKQAVKITREWIEKAFQEFDMSLLDNQVPIVMNMRQTMLTDEPEETIIGYNIKYCNQYDGIKILYEGISVMLDDSGIISGNIEWNDYEKIEPTEDNEAVQKVNFEKSQVLVADAIKKANEEFGLDADSEDAITVNNVELVFAQEEENGAYRPVWFYEMVDGRTYYVNCIDGQVSYM